MRFYKKAKPVRGTFRVKKRFLFLPKTIENETRWLEWGVWGEEYAQVRDWGIVVPYLFDKWVVTSWYN